MYNSTGFTTDKPLHFKEVPVFEPNKTSNAINTPSNDDDVPIHLYIPNLAKVSNSIQKQL